MRGRAGRGVAAALVYAGVMWPVAVQSPLGGYMAALLAGLQRRFLNSPFRRLVLMRADEALESRLPGLRHDGAPSAWLIDPAGFVALRYPPGFDVAHLREDVARMLKQ